jgi:hypothetical protein
VKLACFELRAPWGGALWRFSEGAKDPVTPTTSMRSRVYTPYAQEDLAVGMENLFPWPTLNLRKGIGMFPRPRACPLEGVTPLLPKCLTQEMTIFVVPLFPKTRYLHMKPHALLGGGMLDSWGIG